MPEMQREISQDAAQREMRLRERPDSDRPGRERQQVSRQSEGDSRPIRRPSLHQAEDRAGGELDKLDIQFRSGEGQQPGRLLLALIPEGWRPSRQNHRTYPRASS